MKKLLNKSFVPFLGFASIAVLLSIPLFYLVIQHIYIRDTDESLLIARRKLEDNLNASQRNKEETLRRIELINELQIGFEIRTSTNERFPNDSVFTVNRFDEYHGHVEPFRVLETMIEIHQVPFHLKVEMDMEEYYDVIPYIAIVAGLFFLTILTGYYFINRYISFRVWSPFYQMMQQLENYRINDTENFVHVDTDIFEFSKLQQILNKFISRNKSLFAELKSFTENASHELQTPLAIVKNKLDLLLQKETLTGRQYQLIEETNRALTRMSRINKNLLLLAKIENRQFDDNEMVDISLLADQCLEQVKEHADHKNISVTTKAADHIILKGNKTLIEILIHNLLLNAIRHNPGNGTIAVFLDKDGLSISNSGNTALEDSTLFKRFAKISAESSGSGLGLAIIREICNFHHWSVRYQFENGCHQFSISF